MSFGWQGFGGKFPQMTFLPDCFKVGTIILPYYVNSKVSPQYLT